MKFDIYKPPTATVSFYCYASDRVTCDIGFQRNGDKGTENALAIERLVRVGMRARGAHRKAIEAAVNTAEQAQKEQAQ